MKTVAVDFDATLAKYHKYEGPTKIGKPIKGAREFLRQLKSRKLRVIIHTCRTFEPGGLEAIQDWMERHRMPYDGIHIGVGKPYAIAYVDDRGVSCRPQEDPEAYVMALEQIDYLNH